MAAKAWIAASDFSARSYQFDAVSARIMPGEAVELEHVEGPWTE